MKLSVIVPSLTGAVPQSLCEQAACSDDVEIVSIVGVSPVGKARNEGLSRARGEYVAWVDGDDEIAPNWLSEILNALETRPDLVVIDAEAIGGRCPPVLVLGEPAGAISTDRLLRLVYENERLGGYLWRIVSRRSLWQPLRFDETAVILEDFLLLPRLFASAGSAVYVPKCLYRYIRGGESLISSQSAAVRAQSIEIVLRRWAETPVAYRNESLRGTAWQLYYTLLAAELDGVRLDPVISASACAFLRAHNRAVARSFRERLRLWTASRDCWVLQRLAHRKVVAG